MKIFNFFSNKAVTFVVGLIFILYFAVTLISQSNTANEYKMLLDNYNEKVSEQKDIAVAISEEEKQLGTDEFIEKTARERLGMCKSTEKIFVDGKIN